MFRMGWSGDIAMKDQESKISEIIEMAWCDKTSFDDIFEVTGLSETETINVMRTHLKPNSFKLWRKRVFGRKSKHKKLKDSM